MTEILAEAYRSRTYLRPLSLTLVLKTRRNTGYETPPLEKIGKSGLPVNPWHILSSVHLAIWGKKPYCENESAEFCGKPCHQFLREEIFMNNTSRDQVQSYGRSNVAVYMQQVYLWMTAALGVTAFAAVFTASNMAIMQFLFTNTIMMILLMVGIIGLSMYITARIHRLSAGTATGLFLLYSALMGVFLGPVLLVYTGASVAQAFIVTAGMFGGMSVFGMVTRRDLSGMGSFLMMGLWGILLASLVNAFIGNTAVDLTISVLGVIIFTGLTAFDTPTLRIMGESAPVDDSLAMRRGALLGALTLYLDFINMFLFLLRLFGNRNS